MLVLDEKVHINDNRIQLPQANDCNDFISYMSLQHTALYLLIDFCNVSDPHLAQYPLLRPALQQLYCYLIKKLCSVQPRQISLGQFQKSPVLPTVCTVTSEVMPHSVTCAHCSNVIIFGILTFKRCIPMQ